MTHRKRPAFTRIELLISMAIIFLLMVTALPALQRTREDARSKLCQNHLKQLGLAMHNYHDVYITFPPGWVSKREKGEGHPSNGWTVGLLPFLDEARLYNQLNMDDIYEGDDTTLLKKPLALLRCPVDSTPGTNPIRGDWGTSNYSGNYGARSIPRWSTSIASTSFWPGNTRPVKSVKDDSTAGILSVNSSCGIRNIIDGTSNTLMIGEKCILSGSGIWPGPRSNFHESDVVSDASFASPLNRSQFGFSSRHAGFIQFLMCDGSARAISLDIDSKQFNTVKDMGTLQKLAARADGQIIHEF